MNDSVAAHDAWADQRAHPRFPAWITGTLQTGDSVDRHPVLVTDVSLGGVGLRTALPPALDSFRLELEWDETPWRFQCETVFHRPALDEFAVHARFGALNAIQRYCLKLLIADLERQEQSR